MASSKSSSGIVSELENFLEELKSYQGLVEYLRESKTILGHQLRQRDELRERLVRKSGKLRQIIAELTGKQFVEQLGRVYDVWSTGLTANPSAPINTVSLNACIDAANEAIGKLETDMEKGIRDVQGNLIEETKSIDSGESFKAYENLGGRIVGNEFEVALQGTVDMAVECIMHFVKKINSQGYTYKNTPRIGGHPDFAKPDRTCSAICTITKITEGSEKDIGTIKLQLLPNDKTLLKTSLPHEWSSPFKYFMDALFAEFRHLRYIEEENTALISGSPLNVPIAKANWKDIENELGVTKITFGKAINFVSDNFGRNVIFRDVEHAFLLASSGFSKPAVILAGGVIEELLRLYLEHKNISPISNSFDGYIKTCEQEELLKSGISRLSDSVRHFRNLVHLSQEKTKRYTISKATAKGAVASIFTIANDF